MRDRANNLINIADVYILLWCVYFQQGALISSGGVSFQIILILLLIMSIYYGLRTFSDRPLLPYLKGLNILIVFMSIYGVILLIAGDNILLREGGTYVNRIEYLKALYISLLPIYAFYSFGKNGQITEKKLTYYSFLFVALALNSFFNLQSNVLANRINGEAFEITNNVGYTFVSIIPLLLLVKNNTLKKILFGICLSFVYLSMKRGAIVSGTIVGLIFLFILLKKSKRWSKFFTWIFVVISIIGAYYLISELNQNNTYFQSRIEYTLSGETTRDIIYNDLWNHFNKESSIINMLIGNGAYATTKYTINYAHSDWLEILIDQGVLGIFIYIAYWVLFFRTWVLAKKQSNSTISGAILLVLVYYFIKSFFSMSFNVMEIYATLVLSYCLSRVKAESVMKNYKHFC